MLICPACGAANPHSTVRCGKYRAYICGEHCKGCEFFSGYSKPVVHCFYRDRLIEWEKRAAEEQKIHELREKYK